MAGFDELIERLLYDVALSGSRGFDANRFEKAVRAFYQEKKDNGQNSEHDAQDSLFADAPPGNTVVDDKLLLQVLEWLCRHPDVEVCRAKPDADLDISSKNGAPTSAVAIKLDGKRLFTTEDRIWHAIAGHGPDLRRIPQLEFDILSIVAAHSSTGVLQPSIMKLTGQDKRSVPKRTDNLQSKGYITKETVIGSTGKTSLLKLKRYLTVQSLEEAPDETAINNLKPVIHYDKMYNTMVRMLKENNNIITMADLRLGLGIHVAQRWETKILARCVRRLADGGCIRRVTAKLATREGEAITRIGQPTWRKAKAIQLIRQPTEYDRLLWEQSDPNLKNTASDDDDERDAAAAVADTARADDDEHGLVELGGIEEVETDGQRVPGPLQQDPPAEAEAEDDLNDLNDLNDLDRLLDRIPPQWTPNSPLVNQLYNKINEFGEDGISSTQLQSAVVGPLWKRPMDESLAHLTDIWQHSQPPHLRHLTVVRDTAVFGRSAQFKYRTLANYEKAVAAGKAVWDAVLDNTSSKAKKDSLQQKPDLDAWGFPTVPLKTLHGRDGRASLADGRKGVEIERMVAVEMDQDDIVADDDEETVETPAKAKPAAGRSKKATPRRREILIRWDSTGTVPSTKGRGPVSFNGMSINGKKLGRPRKSERQDSEPSAGNASARTPRDPYSMRKRLSSSVVSRFLSDDDDDVESTSEPDDIIPEQSRRRPVPGEGYILQHKPRKIKEQEYIDYDAFAQRTAENRIRLEASNKRKRSAEEAGLSNADGVSKRLRAEATGAHRDRTENVATEGRSPIPAAELPSDRVEHLKAEILRLSDPGLYINPPGAKNAKAGNFLSRGRPRNAKIAVIKSARLRDLAWFTDEEGPRFAAPKPLGRRRTANIGRVVQISQDIIVDSDSEAGRPATKRQKTVTLSGGPDVDMPIDPSIVEDASASEAEDDTSGSPGLDAETRIDDTVANTGEVAHDAAPETIDNDALEEGLRAPSLPIESVVDAGQDAQIPRPVEKPAIAAPKATQTSPAVDRTPPVQAALPGARHQEPQERPDSAEKLAQMNPVTPISNLSESMALQPPSKINTKDTTSFYLSRFAPEHRATPQQQYKLLTAKPGRKSKRDLEVLAALEAIIGPLSRELHAGQRLKPTEVLHPASPADEMAVDPRPSALSESPVANAHVTTTMSEPELRSDRQSRMNGSYQLDQSAQPHASASLQVTNTSGHGTSTPDAARTVSEAIANPVTRAQQESEEDSTDNSETDNDDWTVSQLPNASRAPVSAAAGTPQLSLQQAMQQAVTPQTTLTLPTPVPWPKSTGKAEYFSIAYVDSHPNETFFHAGGGRWKRGMPPPGSYHKTFRGPDPRSASKQQVTTPARPKVHGGPVTKADALGSQRATSASKAGIPVQKSSTPDTSSRTKRAHVPASSPLTIVRPYAEANETERQTVQGRAVSLGSNVGEAQDGVEQLLEDEDNNRHSHTNPEAREEDDPGDPTFEGPAAGNDAMDVDLSEQTGVEIAEVGPSRVLKTTTKKVYGPPRLGGSTQLKRHEIILDAVQRCGGVFPGDSEIWYVLTTAWKKIYGRLPDRHTVERAVEQLMTQKKLKRFRFQFRSKHSSVITKQILADPSLSANDEVVTQMRKQMMRCYPIQYLPVEVEIEQELRESASFKNTRRRKKDGELKPSGNAAASQKRRYEEFPEDPGLVVQQTVDAAAKADQEAQLKGFANAQAMRKHLEEQHGQMRIRFNKTAQEKRRKDKLEAGLDDAGFAAELGAENDGLLGDGAGEMQLDNYQHDLNAAMQPLKAGSDAKISSEVTFDNVLPKGKSTRPVRKTRKPLGSIRAPVPKAARKLWWEDERRYRDATAAHLMSPAQTFTSSNGTFGTSGRGITQQVVNRRAAPGTLTSEQYQRETARVIAQLDRAQDPAHSGNSSARTTLVSFKVPKEKLNAIVSSQPTPATAPSNVDDDEDSLYEGAASPSSVATSPEPEPEPEPPKKRRKYTSRKKRQAEDEADRGSDDEFVPGAAADATNEPRTGKMPKVKGPGARGIKKAFTNRDRQSHRDFKDVDRLVMAIALISAIAGGVEQGKLNWNLIAHALSFRYEGEFLRRRWVHYVRSRKGDVEQLRDDIRQPFLEAYERGDLPTVNFQATHETDWPALLDWVETTIPMKMSVTIDDDPDIPDLLLSRDLVNEKFDIEEGHQLFELNKDDYFTTITDQNRRHLAQRFTLGCLLPGETKPCEQSNGSHLLAKSWVRAVAMTKQHKYKPEGAARKIGVLGANVLKQVATDMVESKMFLQDKKGRHLPGRNFQIHHEVLVQFRRWPATKEIDEHRYLCALAHSWSKINNYFKQMDTLQLIPITSDQDYTVLTNMCAHGMLNLGVELPETKHDFDAPAPKLSPWGYTGTSYQTKRANQDQLKFPLYYTRTANYKFEHELNTEVPVPLEAAVVKGEIGARIPFWVDIHGNLIDDIWDMCLRSILHLVVFRSGMRAVTMEQAHNHKLWHWEIDMILDWMDKTGLACRCGPGEDVNGYWNGGWSATEWWYCAFLPEMVSWESPSQGGLIELD